MASRLATLKPSLRAATTLSQSLPATSTVTTRIPTSTITTQIPTSTTATSIPTSTTYFRITLIRSAIGLPSKSAKVLKALGLRKRMSTVFHPVSPAVAGQIMRVKELIAVAEVDRSLTKQEVREERRPDAGFYVEEPAGTAEKTAQRVEEMAQ